MRQKGAVQLSIRIPRRRIVSAVVKKILRRREEQVKHLRFKVQTTGIWIQLSSQLNPNRLERVLSQKRQCFKAFQEGRGLPRRPQLWRCKFTLPDRMPSDSSYHTLEHQSDFHSWQARMALK